MKSERHVGCVDWEGGGTIDIEGYGECVLIGRGGVGEVYRSTQLSTGATVAIKVLRDVSDESAAWRRARRELAAMVELAGHAHVIGVREVLGLPEGPAIVMEFASGGSVGDMLAARQGPLSIGEAVLVGEQASQALVAAHARGIVHRDIKPHNLLIDHFGQVKLCDFGIASLARSDEFRSQTHALSLRYASPEDLEGDAPVLPSTDIYSLGATLLHLVHGAPPTFRERMSSWQPPEPAEGGAVGVLDPVIAECLRHDPEQRPTAAELFDLLEHLPWNGVGRRRSLVGAPQPFVHAEADAASGVDESAVTDGASAEVADPTVARRSVPLTDEADESEPPGPPVATRSPWSRSFLLAVAVAAVAVAVAVTWWVRSSDDGADRDGASVAVVARPDGLSELTSATWPSGAVGECLVQRSGVETLAAVACDEPHDLQRIATSELELSAEVQSDEELGAAVDARCAAAWQPLGTDTASGRAAVLDLVQLSNSRPRFETLGSGGDRSYQCFIGVPGSRLVGDVMASDAEGSDSGS